MTNVIQLPGAADSIRERLEEADQRAWGDELPAETEKKPTPPSVRTIARQQNIDLAQLVSILEYCRPDGTETESDFVEAYLDTLEGVHTDEFGNRWFQIGEKPTILWSCHTDTVHHEEGKQNVKWDGDFLQLNDPQKNSCLGADDGAGMWLLLELMKAGKEGLYIFHRAEEVGGLGSKHIAAHHEDLLDGIEMAIAFDRRATHSVITRQRGRECCSSEFADDMCDLLNTVEGLNYRPDPTGSFTDTASYTKIIPECTNISVGYYNEHSSKERLDVRHLLRLREAMLTLDLSKVRIKRDPTKVETYSYGGGWGSNRYGSWRGSNSYGSRDDSNMTPFQAMQQLVTDRPASVARMLYNMGFTVDGVKEALNNVWSRSNLDDAKSKPTTMGTPQQGNLLTREEADAQWNSRVAEYIEHTYGSENDYDDDQLEEEPETETEERLWCDDCGEFIDPRDLMTMWPNDGDECPQCFNKDTSVLTIEVDLLSGDIVDA